MYRKINASVVCSACTPDEWSGHGDRRRFRDDRIDRRSVPLGHEKCAEGGWDGVRAASRDEDLWDLLGKQVAEQAAAHRRDRAEKDRRHRAEPGKRCLRGPDGREQPQSDRVQDQDGLTETIGEARRQHGGEAETPRCGHQGGEFRGVLSVIGAA